MANIFGHSLKITSYGESHGPQVGVIIDGLPSEIRIDPVSIQAELDRRRPGQSKITTERNELDQFVIVSGVFEGITTGAPICIQIQNKAQDSKDYEDLKTVYRPGHADFTYTKKYGHRDHRGGGRSSARITASWVAAGAIVKQFLKTNYKIEIQSVVSQIGNIEVESIYEQDWVNAESNAVRCPDLKLADEMESLIIQTKEAGDSLGGCISTRVKNCMIGLGEPVFDKLNADLAKAIFSINAVKGIEFGSGFAGTEAKGSQNNDTAGTDRNNDGGITGGISNGKDIQFKTAFKPVSSISMTQNAYNNKGDISQLSIQGKHDPCVLPRAVPIVEAMTALVIGDHLLMNLKYKR